MSSYTVPPIKTPIPEALVPSAINGMNTEQNGKSYLVIFSILLSLAIIVFCIFYIVNLYRHSGNVDRTTFHVGRFERGNAFTVIERGLPKELREMLPTVTFGESSAVKDSHCTICLREYQESEKIIQIPPCGHIFHMECIDLWLTSHNTCPLCRLLLTAMVSEDPSYQALYIAPSMDNSNGGGSAEPEFPSTTEAIIHINNNQEDTG